MRTPSSHEWQDSAGKWPNELEKFEGNRYFHPGKGHVYKVIGVIYQSEMDRWMITYQLLNEDGDRQGRIFAHLPEDFFREGRFLKVN